MGTGATIFVTGLGTFFRASGTTIMACGNTMWNQIEVSSGAHVVFESNTIIRDANTALFPTTSANMAEISVTNTKFEANRIGVRVSDRTFFPKVFAGNLFLGGTLKGGGSADAGMQFSNCLDGAVTNRNQFNGLQTGIRLTGSKLRVSNCQFSNMKSQLSPEPLGWGITASKSDLTVSQNCTFTGDASGGIRSTSAVRLDVRNCTFINEAVYGISATGNTTVANIWLLSNTFTYNNGNGGSVVSAILHERSPSVSSTTMSNRITKNVVTVAGLSGIRGARLIHARALNGGTDVFPVWNNTLNSQSIDSSWGIYATGQANGFRLNFNTLSFQGSGGKGIVLGVAAESMTPIPNSSSSLNTIDSNTVTARWSGFNSSMLCGIHLVASPNVGLCQNSVDQSYRGFHFGGNLRFCNFARNTIGTHHEGIDCLGSAGAPSCNMGDQRWHENIWSGPLSTPFSLGARYSDALGLNLLPPFQFFVDQTVAGHMPPSFSPSGWFQSGPNEGSTSPCVNATNTAEMAFPTAEDSAVMAGLYAPQSEADAWEAQRSCWDRIDRLYSGTPPVGTLAAQFYEANRLASPGVFAAFERNLGEVFDFPEPTRSQWLTLTQTQEGLETQLAQTLEAIENAGESIPADLLAQKETLINQLSPVNGALFDLASGCRAFTAQRVAALETAYGQLPTAKPFEHNLKTVLGMRMKLALGEFLGEMEWDLLRPIAKQCILKGGLAVYAARELLPSAESSHYVQELYEPEDCYIEPRAAAPTEAAPVSMWPNPAHDVLWVSKPGAGQNFWSVSDATGRRLKQGEAQSPYFSIGLEGLPNGLYWLHLDAPGTAPMKPLPFVVLH